MAKRNKSTIVIAISEIEHLIEKYGAFPISNNECLLRGTLAYCATALKQMKLSNMTHGIIIAHIKGLVSVAKRFYNQYKKDPDMLKQVNLQYIERYFEQIQRVCNTAGVLPLLEDLTLRQSLAIRRAYIAFVEEKKQ